LVLLLETIFLMGIMGTKNFFILATDLEGSSFGIIIGLSGLPLGWLAYQSWDSFYNLFLNRWRVTIRKLAKMYEGKDKLNRYSIRIIANSVIQTQRRHCSERNPRVSNHHNYTDNSHARGVVFSNVLLLGIINIISYYFLKDWLKTDLSRNWIHFDHKIILIYIILSSVIILVNFLSYLRVHRESQLFGWLMVRERKDEIEECLNQLPEELPNIFKSQISENFKIPSEWMEKWPDQSQFNHSQNNQLITSGNRDEIDLKTTNGPT